MTRETGGRDGKAADSVARFLPVHDSPETRSLVARLMKSRDAAEDFLALLEPDAIMRVAGDRRLCRFCGDYRGRQQITALFADLDAEFARRTLKLLNLVIDGDCVGLRRLVELTHRGSAQTELIVVSCLMRVRDGLIAEIHEFADTAILQRLMNG